MSGPVPHLRLRPTRTLTAAAATGGWWHVAVSARTASVVPVLRDAVGRLGRLAARMWARRVVSLALLLVVATATPLAVTAPAPNLTAGARAGVWVRPEPQVLEFDVADLASPPQPPGVMPAPRFDLTALTGVQREVADRLIVLGRGSEFVCLGNIFTEESDWRWQIVAADTGGFSYGLGQRHGPTWGAPPDPWPVADQVDWFVAYADTRYGGMCPAWRMWDERAAARGGRGWW